MERIQKLLAHLGLGSRREIERLIQQGRVQVNGQIAQLGTQISLQDTVTLDGQVITLTARDQIKPRLIRLNKPEGVMSTAHDPEGRPTVFHYLPPLHQGRWIMIGRLDLNTSGLLLFTNDGALANQLMHPRTQVEREYAVRVFGEVTPDMIQALLKGVMLDDGPARFSSIVQKGGEGINQWFDCILLEGRYREVRRLWASQGLQVSRLIRKRYGNLNLGSLPVGQWSEVSEEQIDLLRSELQSK